MLMVALVLIVINTYPIRTNDMVRERNERGNIATVYRAYQTGWPFPFLFSYKIDRDLSNFIPSKDDFHKSWRLEELGKNVLIGVGMVLGVMLLTEIALKLRGRTS